jgi:hypothetical protein
LIFSGKKFPFIFRKKIFDFFWKIIPDFFGKKFQIR